MIIVPRDFDKTDNVLKLPQDLVRPLIFADTSKLMRWLGTHIGPYKSKRARHKKDFGNERNWTTEVVTLQNELGDQFNIACYGPWQMKVPTSIYHYWGKGWKYVIVFYEDYPTASKYESYLRFDNDAQAVHYQLAYKFQ